MVKRDGKPRAVNKMKYTFFKSMTLQSTVEIRKTRMTANKKLRGSIWGIHINVVAATCSEHDCLNVMLNIAFHSMFQCFVTFFFLFISGKPKLQTFSNKERILQRFIQTGFECSVKIHKISLASLI